LEFDIERVKDLIAKREEIDSELVAIFGGKQVGRRTSWDNVASQGVARRLQLSLVGVDFHLT
jgi:hypothetical protein